MKSVLNSRFELTGNEMPRLVKLCAFDKIVPIGNLRGGPGTKCLVVLCVLHYFGYWGYLIKAKYGHQAGAVRTLVQRIYT